MPVLVWIAIMVFLLNIPFGYWRANVKRFSWQWFLAIHIPVAIVVAIRFLSQIGFEAYTYIVLVSAFTLGQQSGVLIIKRVRNVAEEVTSCLVIDLIRMIRK